MDWRDSGNSYWPHGFFSSPSGCASPSSASELNVAATALWYFADQLQSLCFECYHRYPVEPNFSKWSMAKYVDWSTAGSTLVSTPSSTDARDATASSVDYSRPGSTAACSTLSPCSGSGEHPPSLNFEYSGYVREVLNYATPAKRCALGRFSLLVGLDVNLFHKENLVRLLMLRCFGIRWSLWLGQGGSRLALKVLGSACKVASEYRLRNGPGNGRGFV